MKTSTMESALESTCSYKLLVYVKSLHEACHQSYAVNAMAEIVQGSTADGFLRLNELFNGALDELGRANFRSEDSRQAQIKKLNAVHQEIINSLFSRGGVNSTGPLVSDVALEKLTAIAELVSEKDIFPLVLVDRSQIMSTTEELLSEIMEWDIEKYCKDALVIKINAVQRIVQASTDPSALNVREKVKEIIADFSVEFMKMDRNHQRQLERLATWAGGLFKKGERILGLAVLGKETLALAAPVINQITAG